MDKLVERETATRNPLVAAPALAVQFFLIPLAVVGITVTVYVGFRSLLANDRTPQEYLSEVRNGGSDRRWPAAYELSRLMGDPKVRADRTLAPALVKAFEAAKDDDPRVRQYLALAIGRLDPPLPPEAVAGLTKALDSADGESRVSAIWALGSSGDPVGGGDAAAARRVARQRHSQDGGLRARRAARRRPARDAADGARRIPSRTCAGTRRSRSSRKGHHEGVAVIRQMMDRQYVEQQVKRDVRQDEDRDPIADVMISGLRAAATLKDAALKPSVTTLSQQDRSMKVRQAALEALKVMG